MNKCIIIGKIEKAFQLFKDEGTQEHLMYNGSRLYATTIDVTRVSGIVDKITVAIPEKLYTETISERIIVRGSLRTFNDSRHKLILYVLAESISPANDVHDTNLLTLSGNLCKKTVFRKTPLGREITELLIANNQYDNDGHSIPSYIPSICWNANARAAEEYSVGDWLLVKGRIQSRVYEKTNDSGESTEYTVNELSIGRIIKHNRPIVSITHD